MPYRPVREKRPPRSPRREAAPERKVVVRKKQAPLVSERGEVQAGTWVEIERTIMRRFERAPTVPIDTKGMPYVMHVSGFLDHKARLGDPVTITTLIGRKQNGTLLQANPSYTHSFGTTVPELIHIGLEETLQNTASPAEAGTPKGVPTHV